jgi:phospholipid transport system substrate-binding protein
MRTPPAGKHRANGNSAHASFWPRPVMRAVGPIFCLVMLMFSPEAQATTPAETFVAASIQKGNAILHDESLNQSERDREFRDFILSITDMKRVALFTLGPYAKDAPGEAVAGFVAALTDFNVALYRNGFRSYAQTTRVIGSVVRADDDVIVNAEVANPDGKSEPMKIAFRVRKNDEGRYIILDVELSGAWLAISQRQDFDSYLLLNGGDIAKLSEELGSRIAK